MDAVLSDFFDHASRIVWCNAASVGPDGRPRSRLLHPVWEKVDDRLVGWVLTNPTPIKRSHLAAQPYLSCGYWDPEHHTAVAECRAAWWPDPGEAWTKAVAADPPMGYDPASLKLWTGPDDPGCAAIRLDPWQVVVRTLPEMAEGKRPRVWRG